MAVIGAILGDIAGSIYEFYRPKDLDWKHCELFTKQNFYTDDTVLTLACKLAILKDIPFSEAYTTLAQKYPDESYGGLFKDWLKNPPIALAMVLQCDVHSLESTLAKKAMLLNTQSNQPNALTVILKE